jgi:hypothetical protein
VKGMVELSERRVIKKFKEYYLQTIKVKYPNVNVKNMIESWSKSVKQYQDWLDKYNDYVEEGKKLATQAIDEGIKTFEAEINHVLGLTDEEKFKYWNEVFIKQLDELNKMKESREDLIKEQEVKNLELLNKYKQTYEIELRNKSEALKQWQEVR